VRLSLCNEVLQPMPFEAQCDYAAALGYDGLELAPFTVSSEPHLMPSAARARIRAAASQSGIVITGLHWLLVAPAGLSITSADSNLRARTVDVMRGLIDLCADVGGSVLVHGSPAQRKIPTGDSLATALARATECFAAVADHARAAGVCYCIEPLARPETDLINTLDEAIAVVDAIGHPNLRTMIDCSAAGQMEADPVAHLIERGLRSGHVAHIQVNDPNRRGPGQGSARFAEVFAALKRNRYAGVVAVEPFQYVPDGAGAAARAIGYVRGLMEASEAVSESLVGHD
jgi:D-psicose/D-tagatose/L-ribulose 3-epimerase